MTVNSTLLEDVIIQLILVEGAAVCNIIYTSHHDDPSRV
jgi:hypothetical protein